MLSPTYSRMAIIVAMVAGCGSEDVARHYAADTLEDGVAATREYLRESRGQGERSKAILETLANPRLHWLAPCRATIEFDYSFQGRTEVGVAMLRADTAGVWVVEDFFPLTSSQR